MSKFIYGSGSADDLREEGWIVAIHNDYQQKGVKFTFWLFTKELSRENIIAIVGEGHSDVMALDNVRDQISRRMKLGIVERDAIPPDKQEREEDMVLTAAKNIPTDILRLVLRSSQTAEMFTLALFAKAELEKRGEKVDGKAEVVG